MKYRNKDEGNQALNHHVVLMICMGLEHFTWKCKCALFTMIVELHLAWKSPHLDMICNLTALSHYNTQNLQTREHEWPD
jgi:hypothetical protein